MLMTIASHFFAGALLTLLMPVGLLVLVGAYWAVLLRRRSAGARTEKTSD
jgi:cytochrome c-type biogenesis protein CcmH/NrfF